MAAKYYLLYSVQVDGTSSAPSSTLQLYTDSYGTPEATGTIVGVWSGTGPGLTAIQVDGVYKANKTSWTETMSGGSPMDVEVSGAGTAAAKIVINYQGNEIVFDATALELSQSSQWPAYFEYNKNGVLCSEQSAGYTSSLSTATAVSADSIRLAGTLDPAADYYIFRWYAASDPNTILGSMRLTGTTAEVFPVTIVGLSPGTSYKFEIVSVGAKGESVSTAIAGTTSAAAQLSAPSITISATDNEAVKELTINDVTGAGSFVIEVAPGDDFTDEGVIELTATNDEGATVYLREWPESDGSIYSVRVKAIAGSVAYTDSNWSAEESVTINKNAEPETSDAVIPMYSNIALYAEPSATNHLVTLAKVEGMIDAALEDFDTVVTSIGGLDGDVTITQLYDAAVTDGKIIRHATSANPNVNNLSVIKSSSTDAQIATAKAVYWYVEKTRSALASSIGGHYHSYLYDASGSYVVAAPSLDADATIVVDTVLGDEFNSATTYQAGAVVVSEGSLYQNTSGETSAGNRDFQRKFSKVTLVDLIESAAANSAGAARYETEFYGADLDSNHQIVITHNLGKQFVVVQLVDITSGTGNLVVSGQVKLTSENSATVTLSSGVSGSAHFKVIVLG